MTGPSYDECIVEAELRARSSYSEPHRRYHDELHLNECLREIDWITGLTAREIRLLKWAVLWHDSVYDPGQRDNEERSAQLAERELRACGVPEADVAEVGRLIRTTEQHRVDPGDKLGRLIVSIDLAILGADPSRYADYVAGVRSEYSHVHDELWKAGRSLVLKRLLDGDSIYPDPDFRTRLEAQARANMTEEIKALSEG